MIYIDIDKKCKSRNSIRKNNYAQTALYPRRSWTSKECKFVLERKMSDRELSAVLSRSVQSIQSMRSRLRVSEIVNKEK